MQQLVRLLFLPLANHQTGVVVISFNVWSTNTGMSLYSGDYTQKWRLVIWLMHSCRNNSSISICISSHKDKASLSVDSYCFISATTESICYQRTFRTCTWERTYGSSSFSLVSHVWLWAHHLTVCSLSPTVQFWLQLSSRVVTMIFRFGWYKLWPMPLHEKSLDVHSEF